MLTPKEQLEADRNIKSRKRAVELMCKRCIYFPEGHGTWRQQVEDNCPDHSCPLYNWRPCVGGEARKAHGLTRIESKPLSLLE